MAIVILLSLLMLILNMYGIILSLPSLMFTLFFINFRLSLNTANYPYFFQTVGIHHRLICPHTHEQNGTVERRHRHIVETGLTLLGKCKAPF
jgi:hypothetical protein